jgi:Transposase IS116/IS110/IS902 family
MKRPTSALQGAGYAARAPLNAEPHTKEVGRGEVYYHHCLRSARGDDASEHSSGAKQARGPITKTGNAHLRRVLVETAWQYRHHAFLGPALTKRQRGAPAVGIDIAWHAQRRLHRRYRALAARGKPKQHIAPPWHANSPASSGPH